jgi:predicted RNase H-like nuclease (RuvC/YqgF family)
MQVAKQTAELSTQASQVQELLRTCEELRRQSQSADERARETDPKAIEWLKQQLEQFKQDADKAKQELQQARNEALEAKQLALATRQSSAPEPASRSILRNGLETSTPKAVTFSQSRTPPDPMSDSDEEMSVVQEPVPMDKGKGKMVDRGRKTVRDFYSM